MGEGVEVSDGDFEACPGAELQMLVNRKAAGGDSRRQVDLLPAVVWPVAIEIGIDFHLRPDLSPAAILHGIVQNEAPAQDRRLRAGQIGAEMFPGRRNFPIPYRRQSWA